MSESEVIRFFQACLVVNVCLTYSFAIGKIVPEGKARALFISPVVALFLLLPLRLTSVTLCGAISFVCWLATFKLTLLSFGKGPLSTNCPTITLARFLALGSLPIIISKKSEVIKNRDASCYPKMKSWVFATKVLLFALLYKMTTLEDQLHPVFIFFIKGILLCLSLDFILVYAFQALVETILGLELDQLFNNPFLSTSVQNFWGRRWNLAMSNVLRDSVYDPVRVLLSPHVGSKHAQRLGVITTFCTSGIMHEVALYYLSRKRPTWELSWYFFLQGVTVVIEMDVKRLARQRRRLPRLVSTPLTVGFLLITSIKLIAPQIYYCNCDVRVAEEFTAFPTFLRSLRNGAIPNSFHGRVTLSHFWPQILYM